MRIEDKARLTAVRKSYEVVRGVEVDANRKSGEGGRRAVIGGGGDRCGRCGVGGGRIAGRRGRRSRGRRQTCRRVRSSGRRRSRSQGFKGSLGVARNLQRDGQDYAVLRVDEFKWRG